MSLHMDKLKISSQLYITKEIKTATLFMHKSLRLVWYCFPGGNYYIYNYIDHVTTCLKREITLHISDQSLIKTYLKQNKKLPPVFSNIFAMNTRFLPLNLKKKRYLKIIVATII